MRDEHVDLFLIKIESKSKAMKIDNNNANQQDLFSLLPDELLHHILSFLDMTLVVKTSILSKRWRYLWSSLPILNFNKEYYDNGQHPILTGALVDFISFVNMVLFLRRGTNINTFRIEGNRFRIEGKQITSSHVYAWNHVAVFNNVEELDLQISCEKDRLKFPRSLFTCKSLTTLKLDMGWKPILDFPDTIDLPSLRNVHLRYIRFYCKGISNFISRCPVLERLTINHCSLSGQTNDITISSLQLKELDIELIRYTSGYCNVTVSAPRLVSFACRDYLKMHCYNLVDISSLVRAELELWTNAYEYESEWTSENVERMIMCLQGVSTVRSLTLSISAKLLKSFIGVPAGLGGVTSFCNLIVLILKAVTSRFSVPCVMYLLEKCPNLETFILNTDTHPLIYLFWERTLINQVKSNSKNRLNSWKAELQLECMHHLKLIEFKGFNGYDIELKFLKFFLKNAMVLEKMIISNSDQAQSVACQVRVKKFRAQLPTFPSASSSVHVVFPTLLHSYTVYGRN